LGKWQEYVTRGDSTGEALATWQAAAASTEANEPQHQGGFKAFISLEVQIRMAGLRGRGEDLGNRSDHDPEQCSLMACKAVAGVPPTMFSNTPFITWQRPSRGAGLTWA
jgi:hypothetical protein